ncbi:hypothetical protein Q4566_15365 [Tamlana sp. 2_MG-2023]|jgi:hypothetical protein|uniref:hypothetical protein n=1 Tax=unclassified Tamlana TaxID=2614803 RepID=UPI0026E17742|nr:MULTISPECIES: hypothetical protein [unclassified Tamlana]MDO6761588.1 hypothetical protein [Tamlana sp. 2_MG-2023]MDO6792440.1 hypothetical protein [Tamlana sp. 1_MG-2023]
MATKYKIGYIDEDVKQVKKYQRRFRDFEIEIIGYDFNKGMSLNELMVQVYSSPIDLLMIDYKLRETNLVAFNGEAVESEFYDKRPLFPYIIFTNKVDQAEPFVEDWSKIFDKDEIFSEEEEDKEKVQHFITTLTKKIEQYRSHIEKKKNTISELLLKGQAEGLSSSEEDKLLSLQRELRDLDKTKVKEVPEKLISYDKLEDLSKTRKEAEAFLQSLIEKSKGK